MDKKAAEQIAKNEKIIAKDPVLRDLREASGYRPNGGKTGWHGGKGSSARHVDKAKFDAGWDAIDWGKKDK